MAKSRTIPIDIAKGTSKDITVLCKDEPDLTDAVATITVKQHIVDEVCVLVRNFDITKSTSLETGELIFTFTPEDTLNLTARTYTYELKVVSQGVTVIPLIGDFNIFDTVST